MRLHKGGLMYKKNKNKAFSLAEMLVSFTLVAVITGVLVGTFRDQGPKENILNYQKTYATLQKSISLMLANREAFPDEDLVFMIDGTRQPDGSYVFTTIINDGVEEFVENTSSNHFCRELVRELNTINTPVRGDSPATPNCTTGGLNITLSNGVQLFDVARNTFAGADDDSFLRDHIDIMVDTNGRKGPNSINPSAKRDRFRIRIDYEGKITTDANWTAENAIFRAGNRPQTLKLEELIDNE